MNDQEFKSLKVGDILSATQEPMRWIVLEIERKGGYIRYKNLNMPEFGEFWYYYKTVFPSGSFYKVYQIEGFEV